MAWYHDKGRLFAAVVILYFIVLLGGGYVLVSRSEAVKADDAKEYSPDYYFISSEFDAMKLNKVVKSIQKGFKNSSQQDSNNSTTSQITFVMFGTKDGDEYRHDNVRLKYVTFNSLLKDLSADFGANYSYVEKLTLLKKENSREQVNRELWGPLMLYWAHKNLPTRGVQTIYFDANFAVANIPDLLLQLKAHDYVFGYDPNTNASYSLGINFGSQLNLQFLQPLVKSFLKSPDEQTAARGDTTEAFNLLHAVDKYQADVVLTPTVAKKIENIFIFDSDNQYTTKIAFLVTSVKAAPNEQVFGTLIPSIKNTISKESGKYEYIIYLAIGKGVSPMKTLKHFDKIKENYPISLKVLKFDLQPQNAQPVLVWNSLAQHAYDSGVEYFYQVDAFVELESAGWTESFVALLQNSTIPGFGVVGPLDVSNQRVFTQSFVHRTHMDVFGMYFPSRFQISFYDQWITSVYQSFAFRTKSKIKSHLKSFDMSDDRVFDSAIFSEELQKGQQTIQMWKMENALVFDQ